MYQLFVDTLSDFTPEICEEFGAKLISIPYAIDGKAYYPCESKDELSDEEFIKLVRDGAKLTTFSVPIEKYIEYFEPIFKEGKDILYVHFTNECSSTYNACRLAIQELLEKYPDRRYYDFDTKAIALGALAIGLVACKAFKAGKPVEEVIKLLEDERDHYAAYFFCEDLKYFARSGRFNGFAIALASIVGIKPMIQCAQNGKLMISNKPKGRTNAMNLLFEILDNLGDDITNPDNELILAHIDDNDQFEIMCNRFYEKYGKKPHYRIDKVNRTAICHAGSLAVGFSFHSKSR